MMPTIFKVRPLVAIMVSAGMFLIPQGARAQAPSSTTVTVSPDGTASVSLNAPGNAGFAPSRVIVRFRGGTSFLPGSGVSRALSARTNVHLVNNPPGLSVAQVIARYQANPNVVYAEPDYTVNAILSPNDPEYLNPLNKQWLIEYVGEFVIAAVIGSVLFLAIGIVAVVRRRVRNCCWGGYKPSWE